LQYHLLTSFTSFVAVEESGNLVKPGEKSFTTPVETPDGVTLKGIFNGAPLSLSAPPASLPGYNVPGNFGSVSGPRDLNLFQVEPTVIDERHYTSGRDERHANVQPTLPGTLNPSHNLHFTVARPSGGGRTGQAAEVAVISTLGKPATSNATTADSKSPTSRLKSPAADSKLTLTQSTSASEQSKLAPDVEASLSSWKRVVDDSPRLKLTLTISDGNETLYNKLKTLKVALITVLSPNKILVDVPVRKVRLLSKLVEIQYISLPTDSELGGHVSTRTGTGTLPALPPGSPVPDNE
jgi:hypothetical protein